MTRIKPNNIIGKISEEVRQKKWPCLHKECNETAINSHLGQKNGILSELEVDGHLIQVKPSNAHTWHKDCPIEFKKLGITKSISLPIFCNSHDTSIFKYIESPNSDLTSYASFLLFSYRALCAEIRKKEIGNEEQRRVFESKTLDGKIDKVHIQMFRQGLDLGIRDLNILKKELTDEIETNENTYKYWVIELPKYEIFITTIMSAFQIGIRNSYEYDLENLYIHLIPRNNKSLLLIGYHQDYCTEEIKCYCLSWLNITKEQTDIKLTDLITNHVENWVMSPNFFSRLTTKKRNQYIKLLIRNINHSGIPNSANFNLFE